MSAIAAFGDRALRFPLPSGADGVYRRALLATLRALAGVADVVLAETVGAIVLAPGAALDDVRARATAALEQASAPAVGHEPGAAPVLHTLKVVYDGADLAAVSSQVGLSPEQVIALHAAPEYEVAMLGFVPGFAYLRGLDPRLVVARRAEPRTRVPAGAVAIAAEYTGIYPFASPGGWSLLGEALDARVLEESGARFAVGDRVRFEPVERRAYVMSQTRTSRVAAVAPRGAHLDVRKAQGPAIVIDAGRPGHMHEGVPHGGPLVPAGLARANVAVGNPPDTAGIEVYGVCEVAARGGRLTVGDDLGNARQLADGETFAVATAGVARVRYLAVRAGLDVRVVLGGRGTMLGARMGGLDGRALKRGDLLAIAKRAPDAATVAAAAAATAAATPVGALADDAEAPITIELGPDHDPRVSESMLAGSFTIGAASDRVGTRLEGPALPAHELHDARDRRSMPMVEGAIEVTPAGLVVLGPDHPTTGGYPVIGVVSAAALPRLFARPPGARVTFVRAPGITPE